MKDLRSLLIQAGYEERQDKKSVREKKNAERDKKNGAISKDELFKIAYENNKDQYYQVRGIVDAISRDKKDPSVKIVSINSIKIRINGKEYIANHSHLRGDRVKLDLKWKKGQEIVFIAKVMPYRHNNNKFELVNIF